MSYSSDLRERVLSYIHSGGKRTEAARLFGVHRQTVQGWVRLDREKGQRRAGKPGPREGRKVTEAALKAALSKRPDAKLTELGHVFGVDPSTICHACRKWGITRKKNVGLRRAGHYEKKGVSAPS